MSIPIFSFNKYFAISSSRGRNSLIKIVMKSLNGYSPKLHSTSPTKPIIKIIQWGLSIMTTVYLVDQCQCFSAAQCSNTKIFSRFFFIFLLDQFLRGLSPSLLLKTNIHVQSNSLADLRASQLDNSRLIACQAYKRNCMWHLPVVSILYPLLFLNI